jgi:predicted AAA+ superfamily ATPase
MFKRALQLPPPGTESFFLWGPRQTGKTTLLRGSYGNGPWIDLVKAEGFRRYATRPELLRQQLEAAFPPPHTQVVIDEVQKVPERAISPRAALDP